MRKLKIAYFGSPAFSADLLESLLTDPSLPVEFSLVVTQPDKPVGKKHIVTPSPVKLVAQKYRIPCWSAGVREANVFLATWDSGEAGGPTGAQKNSGGANLYDLLTQVDLAIVYAYGFKELIPLDLLGAPKMKFDIGEGKQSGFINVHPSLLPLYRGSSPIAYPILLGDGLTGVSLFVMDEKMDHGPIVMQETIKILNDVRPAMEILLTQTGTNMAKRLLTNLATGTDIKLTPQDHAQATRAPYMVKDDGFILLETLKKALQNEPVTIQELPQILRNYLQKYLPQVKNGSSGFFSTWDSGELLYNFWKGMYPWPGVWTLLPPQKRGSEGQGKITKPTRLKITGMKYDNGILTLTKVQLEGKNEVDFPTFRKAYGF